MEDGFIGRREKVVLCVSQVYRDGDIVLVGEVKEKQDGSVLSVCVYFVQVRNGTKA